jgi:hypothetical protein
MTLGLTPTSFLSPSFVLLEEYVRRFNLPLKSVDTLVTAKDVHLVNTVAVFMTSKYLIYQKL